MHRLLPAAALAFILTAPACAEPDTVVVQREHGLPGLWKIAVPDSFSVSAGFSGTSTHFGNMKNLFCRITDSLEVRCLNGGYAQNGAVSLDGQNIHIAWGTMMLRVVIDGTRSGDAITGTFAFKFSGIRHDDPQASISTRLAIPQDNAPDQSPYLAALLTQLAAGSVTVPQDAKAILQHHGALPTDIAKLGAVQAIAFLGMSPLLDTPDGADFFRAYIVEFAGGERLCGLHQREDGVLDAFHCV